MRRAPIAGVLVMSLLPPLSVRAYELTKTSAGEPTRWPAAHVRYAAESTALLPALGASARAGFDGWSAVPASSLTTTWTGATREDRAVWIRTTTRGEAGDALAVTISAYAVGTATVTGAEIILDVADHGFGDQPGAYDLISVLAHEAGHALGLGHTCGDRSGMYPSCFDLDHLPTRTRRTILEAVMAPTIAPGEARRAPTADDAAGLVALYPGDRGAAPAITAIEAECPAGDWAVVVSGAERVEVSLRHADGRVEPAVVRARAGDRVVIEASTGEVDVQVDDPSTGGRAARVAVVVAPCGTSDDAGSSTLDGGIVAGDSGALQPEPGGCDCVTAAPASPSAALWALGLLLARRRRR